MAAALADARAAAARGEVPIGAVLVIQEKIVARAGNRTRELNDPTAHAEMLVIREAARQAGSQRLADAHLYVTLEPCPMCAAAISFARVERLYFAAEDEKGGAVVNGPRLYQRSGAGACTHRPDVYSGLSEAEAAELLRAFFEQRR